MDFEQPKPDSKKYSDLITELQNGIIKVPKFQRDFVWSIDKTAKLLDSILKGYPIGTFILWQTDERLNDIKNILVNSKTISADGTIKVFDHVFNKLGDMLPVHVSIIPSTKFALKASGGASTDHPTRSPAS